MQFFELAINLLDLGLDAFNPIQHARRRFRNGLKCFDQSTATCVEISVLCLRDYDLIGDRPRRTVEILIGFHEPCEIQSPSVVQYAGFEFGIRPWDVAAASATFRAVTNEKSTTGWNLFASFRLSLADINHGRTAVTTSDQSREEVGKILAT